MSLDRAHTTNQSHPNVYIELTMPMYKQLTIET